MTAEDLEKLRAGCKSGKLKKVSATELLFAMDRLDRLRKAIEAAPHDVLCESVTGVWLQGDDCSCTCWKRAALEGNGMNLVDRNGMIIRPKQTVRIHNQIHPVLDGLITTVDSIHAGLGGVNINFKNGWDDTVCLDPRCIEVIEELRASLEGE